MCWAEAGDEYLGQDDGAGRHGGGGVMEPRVLARVHARCFVNPAPWDAAAFAALLAGPGVRLLADAEGRGFLLARVVADEAEVLTLAVDPAARRAGVARALLGRFDALGAAQGFLEVSAENGAALALYQACGWAEAGRRKGYYRAPGQPIADALILCKSFARPVT